MTNFMTSTPHDALFKSFLTHSDTARDFMEIHLPKDLRELCDLDSLKLESASFVDEKLRALHSDILWSVKTREGEPFTHEELLTLLALARGGIESIVATQKAALAN